MSAIPSAAIRTDHPQHERPAHRTRRIATAVAVATVGALALAGCWSPDQGQDLDLVNQARSRNRAPQVTGDLLAMNKAQAWSERMARTGVLEHTGGGPAVNPAGVSGWCSYYENVGMGPSVAAVHQAFLNSPTHKRNMLSPSHRVGTGVARKGNTVWVTEIYLRNC